MASMKVMLTALSVLAAGTISAADNMGMTPAQKHSDRVDNEMSMDDMEQSPKSMAHQRDKGMMSDHDRAYHSLSPKNKKAFDGLNAKEKKKVVDAHKRGKDHQETLTDILKNDQDHHNDMHDHKDGFFWKDDHHKNMDSPANKAMQRSSKKNESMFD